MTAGDYPEREYDDAVIEGVFDSPGNTTDQGVRIIVCGSRKWNARKLIEATLYDLAVEFGTDITIVHGASGAVDNAAHQEAQKAGLRVEPHPWRDFVVLGEVNEKRAPLERNKHMAALGADLCVAFWDGRSTGTAHMMTEARKAGIPVRVITKAAAS